MVVNADANHLRWDESEKMMCWPAVESIHSLASGILHQASHFVFYLSFLATPTPLLIECCRVPIRVLPCKRSDARSLSLVTVTARMQYK
jgi:hypothetical protein